MRPWLFAMLLLNAVLAGCTEDPTTADDTGDDGTGDNGGDNGGDDGGDNGNGTGAPENNTAPVANLTADALNGTAPLTVDLTLDGTDADGDNLTWTLHLDGNATANGTALPAAVNVTLGPGDHSLLLTVSDGLANATANLTIQVASAPSVPTVEPMFVVREMLEGCYLCIDSKEATGEEMGAPGCVGWNLEENELDCGWVAFGPEYQGLPYSVHSYTSGTLIPFGSDGHPDVEFYDACGPDAELIEQHFDQDGDTVTGVVPEGAGCIVGFEFHWPNVGHTIEFSIGAVAE